MPVAILRRKRESGVTIHKITEQFDQGDILLQASFLLDADETHQTYMEKVYQKLPDLLGQLLTKKDELWEKAVPQTGGEYWAAPDEKDYTVDSDMTAEQADLILRAFFGYICIYRNRDGYNEEMYEVTEGRAVKRKRTSHDIMCLRDGVIEAINIRKIDGNENTGNQD